MGIRKRADTGSSRRIHAPLNRIKRSLSAVESGVSIVAGENSKLMVKRSLRGSIGESFKKLRTVFKSGTDNNSQQSTQGKSKGKEPIRSSTSSDTAAMTCFCNNPRNAVVEGRSIICDCANGQALYQRRVREWDEGEEIWSRANWMMHVNSQAAAAEQVPPAGFEAKDLPLVGCIPLGPAEGEAGPSNWHGFAKSVSESGASLYVDNGSATSDEDMAPTTGANSEASGVTCFRCNSATKDERQPVTTKPRSESAPEQLLSGLKMTMFENRAQFLRRPSLFAATRMAMKEVVGAPCESAKETRMLKSPTPCIDSATEFAAKDPEESMRETVRRLAQFQLTRGPAPYSSPLSHPSEEILSPLTPLSPVSTQSFPNFDETIATAQNTAHDSHRPSRVSDPLIETAEKLNDANTNNDGSDTNGTSQK